MTMITMVETCEKRYNDNYDNQFIEVCLKNINVKDTIFSLVLLHSISYSSSNFTSTAVIWEHVDCNGCPILTSYWILSQTTI